MHSMDTTTLAATVLEWYAYYAYSLEYYYSTS